MDCAKRSHTFWCNCLLFGLFQNLICVVSRQFQLLDKLDDACHNFEHEAIRAILLNAPLGFEPKDDICDLVWLQNNVKKNEVLVNFAK